MYSHMPSPVQCTCGNDLGDWSLEAESIILSIVCLEQTEQQQWGTVENNDEKKSTTGVGQ